MSKELKAVNTKGTRHIVKYDGKICYAIWTSEGAKYIPLTEKECRELKKVGSK